MTFRIEFVEKNENSITGFSNDAQMDEDANLLGRITLPDEFEFFRSPIGFWKRTDYEKQWRSAIEQVVEGACKTAIITAMYDPETANFINWWPLYREGDRFYIQNQLLFFDKLTSRFDISAIAEIVQERMTINKHGKVLSEWMITLQELNDYACYLRNLQ